MSSKINAIRGMNDILPDKTPYWQQVYAALKDMTFRYGYQEIKLPIVESTQLFKRTIGEATDIVEKEMYTFQDRNGDSLTLRPEGTAGCVRAGIEHSLFYGRQQRLWYTGPMFRHERPQKGRYRQFYQFGLEAFGIPTPDIDAEHVLMMAQLWKTLGVENDVELHINSLGNQEERARYREKLVAYFQQHQDQLDEDSRRRLTSNPLRILDSKNSDMQALIHAAPQLIDHLGEASEQHFSTLRRYLDALHIPYKLNPTLVRGLDYYCHTVYEWVTDSLGAQGTVCAGGRYDGLVEQLGGQATPAAGFALGVERVVSLLEKGYNPSHGPHVYLIGLGEEALIPAMQLAEKLRQTLPAFGFQLHCGGGSAKSQFKRADKSGALLALVMGAEEVKEQTVTIKFLREAREQVQLSLSELKTFLSDNLVRKL